jgi:hypothetical protein
MDPTPGVAVSVTHVPYENSLQQSAPQLIPLGELVTIPVPVPDFETISEPEVPAVAETWFESPDSQVSFLAARTT